MGVVSMNTKHISLVKIRGKPITVGVGKHCFPIENNILIDNENSFMGACALSDQQYCEYLNIPCKPQALQEYKEAFELAKFAWDNQLFDSIIEN